ncbi:GNAT family N-acetyltransferase [Marinomonas sp. 2405UD68-3]|uniref:GNAT family N-acetyltransferase n=1 Tax=Marinomonas sp. 2405UD68-3 TaxID=3391835 RepID=UPI0039C8F6D4
MITIEKYSVRKLAEVSGLHVKPDQVEFAIGNVGETLCKLKPYEHPYLVVLSHQVVGFFILDTEYARHYDFCPPKGLGIRSLFIDHRFQGQGIASRALLKLPSYMKAAYPDAESLYLTVNCRNKVAYHCYEKCGFQKTDDLYLDGPAGPQYIMTHSL